MRRVPIPWLVSLALACGGGGDAPADGGRDARSDAAGDAAGCAGDADCDDGVLCNGVERCGPGGTCVTEPPCAAGLVCDEESGSCLDRCEREPDADGDGHDAMACGGDDCDDADGSRYPGNAEVCDVAGHDEDCDTSTYGFRDADGDTFPDARCCNLDEAGESTCGTDCDDMQPAVHPTEAESCDGLDNDCDGMVDEGVGATGWYPDCDGDLHGRRGADPVTSCRRPSGAPELCGGAAGATWADNGTDCDDDEASVNPSASEVCDGIDNNCDGRLEAFGEDLDGDGFGGPGCGGGADCDDDAADVYPGAPELCDRIDNDCDGAPSAGEDLDDDGLLAVDATCTGGVLAGLRRTDCDDTRDWVNPTQPELCSGRDEDCDGVVDEAAADDACSLPGATSVCEAATCVIDACLTDFRDCNTTDADGCEADLRISAQHCGACGNACDFACIRPDCDDAVDVRAGSELTCALRASGRVDCWGRGASGELGNGAFEGVPYPVEVSGLTDAVEVEPGSSHVCARRAGGSVVCWGSHYDGRLGDGSTAARAVPGPVPGLTDAVSLGVGLYHACVVHAGGTVSCWGGNSDGQIGTGDTVGPVTSPREISGLSGIVRVSAGQSFNCALTDAATVVCWGANTFGQIANGGVGGDVTTPYTLSLANVTEVEAGGFQACAIVAGGQVKCWGDGRWGAAGSTSAYQTSPLDVTGLADAVRLSGGRTHMCAVRAGGTVSCWGDQADGRLGDGVAFGDTHLPVVVAGISDAVRVGASNEFGDGYSCVVHATGAVSCWGGNAQGQLGDGTTVPRLSPVRAFVP